MKYSSGLAPGPDGGEEAAHEMPCYLRADTHKIEGLGDSPLQGGVTHVGLNMWRAGHTRATWAEHSDNQATGALS